MAESSSMSRGKSRARPVLEEAVRGQGLGEGREGHARDETGQAALGRIGPEGAEPQAGDRHRAVRGPAGRGKVPANPNESS